MRFAQFCIAVAFVCLAGSIRAEENAAAELIVPVSVVADESAVAGVEAAMTADVPLVRSKRGLLLLKKLKLAKLGLVGLGLGAAKVAAVGSLLGGLGGKSGGGGGGGPAPQPYPHPQPSYGGGHNGGSLSGSTQYVVEYVPYQQQQQHQKW